MYYSCENFTPFALLFEQNTQFKRVFHNHSHVRCYSIIGVSLSEPHIDCDNSPRMYVSNIFTRVCCTLVPKTGL